MSHAGHALPDRLLQQSSAIFRGRSRSKPPIVLQDLSKKPSPCCRLQAGLKVDWGSDDAEWRDVNAQDVTDERRRAFLNVA